MELQSAPLIPQTRRGAATAGALGDEASPRKNVASVLSIASGKGGVGKTAIVSNMAVALSEMGKRVLVIDADLGLANIDLIFGLTPRYTLNDFFSGERELSEILIEGPGGIQVLPAGSGVQQLSHLSSEQKLRFLEKLEELPEEFDFVLIDTEAGISENVTYFTSASHEILVVTSPEPTSITDAYILMKLLSTEHHQKEFHLIVNMVRNVDEGLGVYRKLLSVASRHLDISIEYCGCIPQERRMRDAVRRQRPLLEVYPDGKSAGALRDLAHCLVKNPPRPRPKGNLQFFWRRQMERGGAHE